MRRRVLKVTRDYPDRLRKRLAALPPDELDAIAERAKVPVWTLRRFARGKTGEMRFDYIVQAGLATAEMSSKGSDFF